MQELRPGAKGCTVRVFVQFGLRHCGAMRRFYSVWFSCRPGAPSLRWPGSRAGKYEGFLKGIFISTLERKNSCGDFRPDLDVDPFRPKPACQKVLRDPLQVRGGAVETIDVSCAPRIEIDFPDDVLRASEQELVQRYPIVSRASHMAVWWARLHLLQAHPYFATR